MDIKNFNGKKVKRILFPAINTEESESLEANDNRLLIIDASYHGDRDEFWVVEKIKISGEFKEVARYNLRYVETVIWE